MKLLIKDPRVQALMGLFRMNLKDPRTQLSWLLILIFLSATFFYKDIYLLKSLAVGVSFCIFFDFLFLKIRKIELFPPAAAITTGIILSILISPKLPAYELILAAAVAMFFKNFVKGSNRHIFNPAGAGVLASSIIFGHPVSWWAVSFQPLTSIFFLILLSPILISIVRMRRYAIILPFLISYPIFLQIINHKSLIINQLFDPTVIFFSLVMLPEPQTTPNKKEVQIFFGIFVAVATILSSKFSSADPLILALLTGNFLFYKLK